MEHHELNHCLIKELHDYQVLGGRREITGQAAILMYSRQFESFRQRSWAFRCRTFLRAARGTPYPAQRWSSTSCWHASGVSLALECLGLTAWALTVRVDKAQCKSMELSMIGFRPYLSDGPVHDHQALLQPPSPSSEARFLHTIREGVLTTVDLSHTKFESFLGILQSAIRCSERSFVHR